MNIERVILVGRGGSGKDFLRLAFEKKGFPFQISYTTRPPRLGEKDGQDYYFLSHEQFNQMKDRDEFFECVTFANNQYGTTKKQFYSRTNPLSVFIMSPKGLKALSCEDRKTSYVIFLDPDDTKLIEERLRKRPGITEQGVKDRLKEDSEQFDPFVVGPPGLRITNPWFDPNEVIDSVYSHL